MTLAELQPGSIVTIEAIETRLPGVERLMVLGLVEGTPVSFVSAALGGDPLEVSCFGVSISLRKDQARCFAVREIKPRA